MAIVFAQPIEDFPVYNSITTFPNQATPDSAFPNSNLLTQDITQVAKSTTNTETITWDFGSTRKFNVVSLLGSNASVRATWTIATSPDNTTYTNIYTAQMFHPNLSADPGAAPYAEDTDPRRNTLETAKSWYYSVSDISTRYIRITVSDTTFTGGKLSFGRLFVGRAFVPKAGVQYGTSIGFDDTGTKDRTDRGALLTSEGRSIVRASIKMDFISSNELYDYVYDFNYWRKSTGEVLVCLDTTVQARLQRNIIYGLLTDGRKIDLNQFEAYSQTWILESF